MSAIETIGTMLRSAPVSEPPSSDASDTPPSAPSYPHPPGKDAWIGLGADFVNTVAPHSESDPTALLLQFLVCLGNVLGRSAHYLVEADEHYGNEFIALVGASSTGRKGTSFGHVRRLFHLAAGDWASKRIMTGLSSGEGLIEAVRDPVIKHGDDGEDVVVDEGVQDKRLLVFQSELATFLKVIQREGNTLSPQLRDAWDGRTLQTLTRHPLTATGAHVSVIGHITRDELLRYIDATELANGMANRFLLAMVKRARLLPDGGNLKDKDLELLARRLADVIGFGKSRGRLERSDSARGLWHDLYPKLEQERAGLLGALMSRASAHVVRLSLIYAISERSSKIEPRHILAACAVWEYCSASAEFIFGNKVGDPVADKILAALRSAENGLTRDEILSKVQSRHNSSAMAGALERLEGSNLARREREKTGGRTAERWYAVVPGDRGEKSEESEKSIIINQETSQISLNSRVHGEDDDAQDWGDLLDGVA